MALSLGTTYRIKSCYNNYTNRYLNVYGNEQVSDNRNVCIWTLDGTANAQKWIYKNYSGYTKLVTSLHTSYALNYYWGNGQNNPGECDIYPHANNNTDSALSIVTIDSTSSAQNIFRIKLANYNLYLTAEGDYDGANVSWQAYSGANSQKWKFEAVASTSTYDTIWPLNNKATYPVTSGFRTINRPTHDGSDMTAPLDTPIYAIYGGTVSKITSEETNPDEGISVRIDHDFGSGNTYRYLRSYYLHMHYTASGLMVGMPVGKGQLIGYVNNTGDSQGNHLHIGIRYKNTAFSTGGDFYEGVDFINPEIILP